MACFWTDNLVVKEDCVGGGGDNVVDVVVDWTDSSSRIYIGDWVWSGDVLYAPAAPAAAGAGHWASAFGPAFEVFRFRNTFVPGGVDLTLGDFTFNPATGDITTDGVVVLPGTNDSGGLGPYTASGMSIEFTTMDIQGVYDALPSEFQYPAWVARSPSVPRRRLGTSFRETINGDIDYNDSASTASIYLLNGTEVYSGAATLTSVNETASTTVGSNNTGEVGPYDNDAYVSGSTYGVALDATPNGMGSVGFDGFYRREVLVQEPAVLDAYLDDIEFFALEDPAGQGFEMPPVGTGTPYAGALPVCHNSIVGGSAGYYIGYTGGGSTVFTNPDSAYELPSETGALVGTLKSSADDGEICRVAVLVYAGF
jgi:hypothetical protein